MCGTYEEIRVYDVVSGRLILGPVGASCVHDLLWSRDGSRLLAGSDDGSIHCWNSDTAQQIGHPWTGHARGIRCLSLSPNGSVLASASFDKTICFWNATTGNFVEQHIWHNGPVKTIRFSPSGESVASLGGDRRICFWRVPWLNSVESQVSMLIRCTLVFILIISIYQTGLALDVLYNTMHLSQVSLNPPPPYSAHIHSAEQVLNFDFGVSTCSLVFSSLAHTCSKVFMTPGPITSSVVSSSHHTPSIQSPNHIGNNSLDTSSMSDQVDLEYILLDVLLGLEERQRLFELRLPNLVLNFVYSLSITIEAFLAG